MLLAILVMKTRVDSKYERNEWFKSLPLIEKLETLNVINFEYI